MFNSDLKNESIAKLEKSIKNYDQKRSLVEKNSVKLFNMRKKCGDEVITPVESFINTLANTPKEFDKSFKAYKAEFKIFRNLIKKFQAKSADANFVAGKTATAGIAAGVGTAALMPAAAMAIATTFGTASTGAAIAGLSGAAATNAALAWLGGGTLLAGGGGMAGGSAFLALAGPIGLGIGAVGVIGGGLLASSKNKEIAEKANKERAKIETALATLNASHLEIKKLLELTSKHFKGILHFLKDLSSTAPTDYNDYTNAHKDKLGAMVNHIEALSMLINKKVK